MKKQTCSARQQFSETMIYRLRSSFRLTVWPILRCLGVLQRLHRHFLWGMVAAPSSSELGSEVTACLIQKVYIANESGHTWSVKANMAVWTGSHRLVCVSFRCAGEFSGAIPTSWMRHWKLHWAIPASTHCVKLLHAMPATEIVSVQIENSILISFIIEHF